MYDINALGRFDRLLDVQPPDECDREDIFRIHTRSMPCSTDVNLNELAKLTEGYTGADIKLVCREAAVAALEVSYSFLHILVKCICIFTGSVADVINKLLLLKQEDLDTPEVAIRHFKLSINRIKPSDVLFYQELAAQFRRFVDDASRRNH